jgi:hypothetical protein
VTVTGSAIVALTGVSAIGEVGTVLVRQDISFSVTGVSATGGVGTASVNTSGVFKVWTGTLWQDEPVKVWNGLTWVVKPVRYWDGTGWV